MKYLLVAMLVIAACTPHREPQSPEEQHLGTSVQVGQDGEEGRSGQGGEEGRSGQDTEDLQRGVNDQWVIQSIVHRGYDQWQQGGTSKTDAVLLFKQAVELADEGRTETEPIDGRHERYRKMLSHDEGLSDLIAAIAKARFFLAEEAYERFDEIELPEFRAERQLPLAVKSWWRREKGPGKAREWEEMLRFLPVEERHKQTESVQFQYWVKHSFQTWIEDTSKALGAATSLYLAAVEEDVPEWEIASAARLGTMHLSMARVYDTAPIDPSLVGDAELEAIYRDALGQKAKMHSHEARGAFEHCLGVGRESHIENEWSRQCAAAIRRLQQ